MSGGYVDYDAKHFSLPPATPLGAKFQHGAFDQKKQYPLNLQATFPNVKKQDTQQMQLPFDQNS